MDIALILSALVLIPLGLAFGWAMTGKDAPENIVPDTGEVNQLVSDVDLNLNKILAKAEIDLAVKMTRPKLKTALNKLVKADILYLADAQYGFSLNTNLTKTLMIDQFASQLAAQQKKDKQNV